MQTEQIHNAPAPDLLKPGVVRKSRIRRVLTAIGTLCLVLHRRLYLVAFAVTVALVLLYQPAMTGFISHHHGWVGSHNLANLSNTTAENYFAGYSLSFDEGKRIKYDYFRRSPGLFIPLQRAVTILPTDTIALQMYLTFQFMNLVCMLSLWLAFSVVRRILPTPNLAMALCLYGFSNWYVTYYRDMFSPDNLSLLGLMLVIYGILDYRERARRWVFHLFSFIAVGLGWGVSSIPLIFVFFVVQLIALFYAARLSPMSWIRGFLRLDSFRALIIATAIVAGSIAYTATIEVERNNSSYRTTSIYGAMKRRNGGNRCNLLQPWKTTTAWKDFIFQQSKRIGRSFCPHAIITPSDISPVMIPLIVLLVFCLLAAIIKWSWSQRLVALLLASSGVLWLIVLTEHARHHEYTAVTLVGIPIIVLAGVLSFVPRWTGAILLLVTTIFFQIGNADIAQLKAERSSQFAWQAQDYQSFREKVPRGASIYYDQGYKRATPRARYAHGFFLNGRHLASDIRHADYAISRNRQFAPKTLTPRNKKLFLFSVDPELSKRIRERDANSQKHLRARKRNSPRGSPALLSSPNKSGN